MRVACEDLHGIPYKSLIMCVSVCALASVVPRRPGGAARPCAEPAQRHARVDAQKEALASASTYSLPYSARVAAGAVSVTKEGAQ